MGVFLWWFTWLWYLSNQKAWGNLLRRSLHFVFAFTSKSCMCSPWLHWRRLCVAGLRDEELQHHGQTPSGWWHCTPASLHDKQGAVHLNVTFCVDYCPCVEASTGRHKSNHKTTAEIQRINLFLLPHQPGDPWSRCCSPGKHCIGN